MAEHRLPRSNWHMALAGAIDAAEDGDVIVVHDLDMAALARAAHARMCPMKAVTFVVGEDDTPLVCVLCGAPWLSAFKNRCACGGFCTWGEAQGAPPLSWDVSPEGWQP